MEETMYVKMEDLEKIVNDLSPAFNIGETVLEEAEKVAISKDDITGCGHWVWYEGLGESIGRFLCSECNGTARYPDTYCPNCGVKMDDEVM